MIDETVEEIQDQQTHSSSIVAVKAARALIEVTEREFATVEEFVRALERNSGALRRASPSHASLQTTQRDVLGRVGTGHDTVAAAKQATLDAIDAVVAGVETAKSEAASHARELISDGDVLLTHDYSSTVLEAMDLAVSDGVHFTVYVTEARPRVIGRKTARVLATYDTVDTHLIVDSATGFYMDHVDRVIVGMDCIVDDTLYNRVGTYPIAATAADADVPVTVVGSSAKIVEAGFTYETDHRNPVEVMSEPAEGFSVDNPAYDGTPVRLIDSVVTDRGVHDFSSL